MDLYSRKIIAWVLALSLEARYVVEAIMQRKWREAMPKGEIGKKSMAAQGYKFCNRLFALERKLDELNDAERQEQRREKAAPIIEEYYAWIETITLPTGKLKEAVTYALNQNSSGVYGMESTHLLWKDNTLSCQVNDETYTAVWTDDRAGNLTINVDHSSQRRDYETEYESPVSQETEHYAVIKLTADEENETLTVNAKLPGMTAAEIKLMPPQFVETEPISPEGAVSITPAMLPSLLESLR